MATAISFMLYVTFRFRLEQSEKIKARLLAVLVAACVFGVVVPVVGKIFDDTAGTFDNRFTFSQPYDSERFSSQREVLARIPTNPLGVGPSQSLTVLPAGVEPHNVYLHVLLEAGWIGAAAFLLFILLTMAFGFICCIKKSVTQQDAIIVFCSLAGLLVQSLFIDSTHWRHFFLLMGLMWGAILHSKYKGYIK